MKQQTSANSWAADLFFLAVGLGVLFFLFLGSRPLFVPDEGRYAEIAREMVARSDYLTPYLNGIKYFEKPVFFYWLGALAIKLGGTSVAALRTINALLAIIGSLLTYAAGRTLYNRSTGLIAAIILSSSSLYFIMAHMISLDLPVTVFLAASLYGFIIAALSPDLRTSRYLTYFAAAAAALAVLTKGLIGAVFPALIAAAWMTITNEWRQCLRLPVISGLVIFLVITVPWHILVNHYNPEFFHFYFIEQHFLRYTTMEIGHYQPAWFFIPTLIAGFFPWIVFLPQAIAASIPLTRKQLATYRSELFFILWAAIIFLFFSFSKSKLIPYILPVIPALAILTARYLSARLQQTSKGLVAGYACLLISAIFIAYALWTINIPLAHPAAASLYLRLSLVPLIAGAVIAMFACYKHPQAALKSAMIGAALFLVFCQASVRFIDTRTIAPLAATLKPLLRADDEVVTYNQYFQDLPFYLERRITILNWQNELTYGMQHQDTRAWMINDDQFWKRWRNKSHHVYMIISRDELRNFHHRHPRESFIILNETNTNALVTNIPLAIPPS